MSETKITQGTNIIIIVFIVGLFAFLINNFGTELLDNPNAELSDNSRAYIGDLTSTGIAGLNTTALVDIEDPIGNTTTKSGLDFALDFLLGKKIASSLKSFLYVSLSFPEWIIVKVFQFDLGGWSWFVTLTKWLWRILIFVAIVYFWRNR